MFGFNISGLWLLAGLLAIGVSAQAYIIGKAYFAGETHEIAKSQAKALETVQTTQKAEERGEAELKKAPSIDVALKKKGWCEDCTPLLSKVPPAAEPAVAATVPAIGEPWKAEIQPVAKKKARKRRAPKTWMCEAMNICLAATDKPVGPLK